MGVPRAELPQWSDIQLLVGQFAKKPLLEGTAVASELVVGPRAKRPLALEIPLFVSDMSFGALSEEAKVALAKGAELAGTGICSGEGGMLPEEQAANSRYFYELASARFGYRSTRCSACQAFHFKGGQGAKTGTGGHLPGDKVSGKIAEVRGLDRGRGHLPPTLPRLDHLDDFRASRTRCARRPAGSRSASSSRPSTSRRTSTSRSSRRRLHHPRRPRRRHRRGAADLPRQHLGADDPGAGPRARHLDGAARADVTLIITGGLRTPADFVKALALGADGVALATRPCRPSAASACAPATPTTARSASRPRSRTCARA